jgi:butyrate kinase
MYRILAINPGSTSTKIGVYDDDQKLFVESISHSEQELAGFNSVIDQYGMRKQVILETLKARGIEIASLSAIAARGGLLPPVKAGAYKVNEDMVWQLKYAPQHEHAANLAALIGDAIAREVGIDAYIYDAISVDEMEPIAKITGLKSMQRKAIGHNLNMRAAGIRYAKEVGKDYKEVTLIISHLGGGISVSVHKNGKIIDTIVDDEGPFSVDRGGGLPGYQLLELAISGKYDRKGLMKLLKTRSGLVDHLGVNSCRIVEERIKSGDKYAALVYEAMGHNIAKNIGKLSVVVKGKVDAIILTGGIANSAMMVEFIKKRVSFIGKVVVYPGENELESLALGILRVLRGEEEPHTFIRTPIKEVLS